MKLCSIRLLLLCPVWLTLGVRPAEKDAIAGIDLEGTVLSHGQQLEEGREAEGPIALLLPTHCNRSGILQLQANTTYRTCGAADAKCKASGIHILNSSCHTLHGAPGALIELSASIVFLRRYGRVRAVKVVGPLGFTLASGTFSLPGAAVSAKMPLSLHADSRGPLVFKKIRSSGSTAGARSKSRVFLRGLGEMLFEELVSTGSIRGGAAVSAQSIVDLRVSRARFRSCSAIGPGGAISASVVNLAKTVGQFWFESCSSASSGGALYTTLAKSQLLSPGFVMFSNCTAASSGGAIFAERAVELKKGRASFIDCSAGSHGGAIAAPLGDVLVTDDANVSIEAGTQSRPDEAVHQSGDISAAKVRLPPGGRITPKSIQVTEDMLAYMPYHYRGKSKLRHIQQRTGAHSSDSTGAQCPPGSHVKVSKLGAVVPGECVVCPVGYASLGQARAEEQGTIEVPTFGTKLVLVRKWSANELQLQYALASTLRDGSQQSLIFHLAHRQNSSWGVCVDTDPDAWSKGDYRNKAYYENLALKITSWPVHVCAAQMSINITFEDGEIHIGDDGLNLGFRRGAEGPNTPLMRVRGSKRSSFWDAVFHLDLGTETIVSQREPDLVVGIGHDTTYVFDPEPAQTCILCSDFGINAADKIACDGGSHLQLRPGYMLIHQQGNQLPELHRCPNAQACPGGHYSVQSDGSPGIQENICADAYDTHSQGCSQCRAAYARTGLDPFVCNPCGATKLWQRISLAVLSTLGLFIVALRSAQARTQAQQIFKILLSFVTIAGRCLSTLTFSPYYSRLLHLSKLWVSTVSVAITSVDILTYIEPGGSSSSLDCWGGRPLDLHENLALVLIVPGSLLLLFLAVGIPVKGSEAGLSVWVVWSNLHMPPLAGAIMKFFPCTVTTEEGERLKIFSMHTGAQCSSGLNGMLQDRLLLQGCGFVLALLVLGPLFWTYLTLHARALGIHDSTIISFLVTGYREEFHWWEAIVLLRKMTIFAVAVFFPLSSNSRSYTIYLAMVMLAALLANNSVRPYSDPALNSLETNVLCLSTLCLVLVGAMQIEWPLQPGHGFAMYILTLVVLFVVIFGTFAHLVWKYCHAERAEGEKAEAQQNSEGYPSDPAQHIQ
mmetsp:Transcript_4841/g.8398  ORF Transcript_4841/g.8398 Transcript_4841/m.8398 type:complete len:1118 (+) Transcript_4841:44-3397(+)